MKGIILAGGNSTRLWPATSVYSKQLSTIYDKPLIYYPIATLMNAGVREILIITKPGEQELFFKLLGNGSNFGLDIKYEVQFAPNGIAEALIIGEKFLENSGCFLILGDNIFYGSQFDKSLQNIDVTKGSHIFTFEVSDPSQYGVLVVDAEGNVKEVIEKPRNAISSNAITGIYFFDNKATKFAKSIKKSDRGELEIVDLIAKYIEIEELKYTKIKRGNAWLDTGTPNGMHDASTFVRILEERSSLKIACLEEIAYKLGLISQSNLHSIISKYPNSNYKKYLESFLSDK